MKRLTHTRTKEIAGPKSTKDPARRGNSKNTSASILKAAKDLFLKHGFDGVTISKVAAKAGVSKGLVHHHFKSKEELYYAFLGRYFTVFAGKLRKRIEPVLDSEDLLGAVFKVYYKFLSDTPEFVRMQLWANLFFQQTLSAYQEMDARAVADEDEDTSFLWRFSTRIVDHLKEQQDKGIIRPDVNPDLIFASAMSLAEHWHETKQRKVGRWFSRGTTADALEDSYLEYSLKLLMDGIRVR